MRSLKIICVIFAFILAFIPMTANAQTPLDKTVSNIENADYTVNIYQINTKEGIVEHLNEYLKGFTESNVDLLGVTVVDFKYAENGGHAGVFSFFAELSYFNTRKTTKTLTGTVNSTSVTVTLSALQSSIFSGEECILSAEISDYDGSRVDWYEANSKNKNGVLLSDFKTPSITLTPNIGVKYYYCIYKGALSNTVCVNVTEAFVPISDIELSNLTLTCGKSTPLTAEIFPENATNTDITWKVTDGEASIISGRITAKKTGIITIKATVKGGGDKGGEYEKYFEIYAEEEKNENKEIKWSVSPPLDGISQMTFTANEKKDIQITSVSDLTANKMINAVNANENVDIIASAYIVCDASDLIKEVSLHVDSEHIGKEVHVISSDKDGNIASLNTVVSSTGEISLPKGKISYVVASSDSSNIDLSFLMLLLPVLPVLLIPIFSYVFKKEKENRF